MWKFTFDAPAGSRILRSRFIGIIHFATANLWWSDDQRAWMSPDDMLDNAVYGNTAPCNSFKAFKRHLRKHPVLRELDEVILVSRFRDHDIRAKWVD
jgi:hypothetical protein